MNREDNGENQREKHSLPGTNQAGKGPESGERDSHENNPGGRGEATKDQLEKHSLPGTNEAGKGPESCETSDPIRPNRA
jgi:hypothetical protein